MRQTKVEHLKKDDQLVGIKVTTEDDKFIIPVIDVRRSDDQRRKAEGMGKAERISRGSKYIKPSYSVLGRSYNASQK